MYNTYARIFKKFVIMALRRGHEVCRGFLPLYIFVLVLWFRTCGYGKFQNKTDEMYANFLEFLAVFLQFFLLGRYKTSVL